MNGQGWFIDENKGLVHKSEVGVSPESMGRRATRSPGTRSPTFRKAAGASPGWLDDLKAQLKKVPTWAWVTGGAGLVLLLVVTRGEKSDWLKKI